MPRALEVRHLRSQVGTCWAIGCVVLLASCAPAVSPQAENPQAPQNAPSGPSRVTVAIGGDANNLATKLDVTGGVFASDFRFMSNSPLVTIDPQGIAHPFLAVEMPSRDRGSWIVHPDGTMATTWRIRDNAVWHDGAPVSAGDFAFALKVYLDDGIAVSNRDPERLIERIEPLDARSFVVRWKETYPFANQLVNGQLEPLPEHILGKLYESDKEAFQNASFWSTTAYVGEGPFRIAEWDKGVRLVYQAFDRFFLGRPKMDEVIFRVIADMSTVVSNVLSGAVDTTVAVTLNHQAAAEVKQRWEQSGAGQMASTATYFRNMQVQHDPGRARPQALFDRRVRQALMHGIDRGSIAEIVTAGASPLADSMVPPSDPLYDRVKRAVATYPFDRGRALALLQEAGWSRTGDTLTNASGQTFPLEIWTSQVSDNETEMSLVAADYTALGIQATQNVIPIARNRDREYRANFPGLTITATSINIPDAMVDFTYNRCPRAENQYAGSNRGCWCHPDFERFFTTANTTLDDRERAEAIVQAFRVLTEEVGVIGMSYNMEIIPVRKGLIGPAPRWPAQPGNTWNVYEWRWV